MQQFLMMDWFWGVDGVVVQASVLLVLLSLFCWTCSLYWECGRWIAARWAPAYWPGDRDLQDLFIYAAAWVWWPAVMASTLHLCGLALGWI